jgi:hypothetical protein
MDNVNKGLAQHYSVCRCSSGFELLGLDHESPFIPQIHRNHIVAECKFVAMGDGREIAPFE